MISISNLTKTYPGKVQALRGVVRRDAALALLASPVRKAGTRAPNRDRPG